jgi:hypothetical protein
MNHFRFKDRKTGQAFRLPGERVGASRKKTTSASAGIADGGQAGRPPYFQE